MNDSPPIVLLTVDSLRVDEPSCYDGGVKTPHIDRIAADGVRFDTAISNGPATLFSFLASFTATYPLERENRTTEGRPLLAEELSNAGYWTAGVHSNPFLSAEYGFDRGFDRFVDFTGPQGDRPGDTDSSEGKSVTGRLLSLTKHALRRSPWLFDLAKETKNWFTLPYERAGGINRAIADILDDRPEDSPIFLWGHYMDTHHPYYPEPEYRAEGDVSDFSVWRMIRLAHRIDTAKRDGSGTVADADVSDLRALYRAQVKRVDDAIGAVVKDLESRGIYDDAWVVVASDHGDEFLEHGSLGHSVQLYDELVHVPLVVKPPAEVEHVNATSELFAYLDIAPTLLDAAGVDAHPDMRGESHLSLVTAGDGGRESVIIEFSHQSARLTAYRTDRWKYILDEARDCAELYDLHADPRERNDRSNEHPEQAAAFRELIEAHVEEEGVPIGATFGNFNDSVRDQLEDLGYL